MTSLVGALLGAAAGSGFFTALIGWRGTPSWTGRSGPTLLTKLRGPLAPLALRLAIAVTGFIAAVVLTKWLVAGLIVGVAGFSAPTVIGAKANRDREIERMAALATWGVEMVRDTIGAASGLIETLKATAATAPAAVRIPVQQLAARAEREPLPDALAKFADEVDHGVADTVSVTLQLAAANQAGSLQEALAELAENTRQEVSMRLRIEASRARQFTSARFIAGVVAVFSVGMVGFSRPYLAPYDTAWGQVALAVIGGLFIGSAIALVKMGQFKKPASNPRRAPHSHNPGHSRRRPPMIVGLALGTVIGIGFAISFWGLFPPREPLQSRLSELNEPTESGHRTETRRDRIGRAAARSFTPLGLRRGRVARDLRATSQSLEELGHRQIGDDAPRSGAAVGCLGHRLDQPNVDLPPAGGRGINPGRRTALPRARSLVARKGPRPPSRVAPPNKRLSGSCGPSPVRRGRNGTGLDRLGGPWHRVGVCRDQAGATASPIGQRTAVGRLRATGPRAGFDRTRRARRMDPAGQHLWISGAIVSAHQGPRLARASSDRSGDRSPAIHGAHVAPCRAHVLGVSGTDRLPGFCRHRQLVNGPAKPTPETPNYRRHEPPQPTFRRRNK